MNRQCQIVSFVVTTKNAGRTIDACLRSLRDQDDPSIEIIVIDNFSTDETPAVAARYADVFVQAGPERSAQRNHGAQLATGDVLVFIDADMVVPPSVSRECRNLFDTEPGVGSAVLPELSFGPGYFARCRALEKELYLGDDQVEGTRAFRREAFEAVSGFDPKLNAFEDWDLTDRVRAHGWRIGRIETAIWHDDGAVSPRAQFRKKRYYGAQSARYLARRGTPRRRRIVRTSLLRSGHRLLAEPVLAPGLVWLKLVEALGLAIGASNALRRHRPPVLAFSRTSGNPSGGDAPTVLHVVGAFDEHEGIGRSIVQITKGVAGEHHLVSARIEAGAHHFRTAHRVGGSIAWFPFSRQGRYRAVLREVDPDVIHLHGGVLMCLWMPAVKAGSRRMVASIYAWARLPSWLRLRQASWRAVLARQVLRPRLLASHALPRGMAAWLFRAGGLQAIVTADPAVEHRLGRHGCPVHRVKSGVQPDARRARLLADRPVIVFAGRSEMVRGIDTLLDAVPALRARVPNLQVRLLLIATAEARLIQREVTTRRLDDIVELVTAPVADLRAEFAAASLAVFPFKFDYVTAPPALTMVEAMSVGLPVVGTDVACLTAVLRDGVNGVVVPPMDSTALANAAVDLLGNPDRWRRLASGAVVTVHTLIAGAPLEATVARAYNPDGARPDEVSA
jgi:glycosyltransferase involved in cell wall biosynthesis